MTPVVVVHGGAGRISDGLDDAALAGVRAAAEAGRKILAGGGSALDAVTAAVRSMEDDPAFNAGRGSCMTIDGKFEADAGIMVGRDRANGAVAAVPDVLDAISLARAVMEDGKHCLIAGPGAVRFARERGIGIFGRGQVWSDKAQRRFERALHRRGETSGQADTVGAVALDERGELCAGCSTGGVLLKEPGRVGDSPVCGAGFYAAPQLGAACATGIGEAILTHVVSYAALRRLADGEDPTQAAAASCKEATARPGATCGLILVAPDGRIGIAHESRDMSWASAVGDEPVRAGLR